MSDDNEFLDREGEPPVLTSVAENSIPLTTRLAIEIPKPKDWQAFQRNCVLLFRSELNDPHAQEYGRSGQKQGGIDILGRRNGNAKHFVGVQCRLIAKPLKQEKILKDARDALELEAGLQELIFATTAPDDAATADAAIAVERILHDEGHDLQIVVYGWGQLQTLISIHEVAYNAFHPAAVGTTAARMAASAPEDVNFADRVAARVVEQMVSTGVAVVRKDTGSTDAAHEDPALHARIDTFRDLFREQGEPVLAERGLLNLLNEEELAKHPWAHFRVETNLGSLAIDLGREADAAARFEAAFVIRPDDPNALANLALARTIQGRFEEAMNAAQAALDGNPRADHAIAYLLQAAARSNWTGDPESLIPSDLVGTLSADVGLAEFLRWREVPGWEQRSLELARRHPDAQDFRRIRAIAILALATASGEIVVGGHGPVSSAELNHAADEMKAIAEHSLDIGFEDRHDLVVYLNNAAALLRLCNRHLECEALLTRAIPIVSSEPQLRRLLALAQTSLDRDADAVATLAGDSDPENQIFLAELQASGGDYTAALSVLLAIDEGALSERLRQIRFRSIGEVALRLGAESELKMAVTGLRALHPDDITASLLEIRGTQKRMEDGDAVQERLRSLATSIPANIDLVSRFILADELANQDLPEEASRLLEGYVDLSRMSPATSLYLQSLADGRRDDAFRDALARSAREVRECPTTQWIVAVHAWNLGDLNASLVAVEAILKQQPENPRARLLKVELLVRQDRSSAVFAELDKPLEDLDGHRPHDQFRIASLLHHFGYEERAAALAYRLFLQHRDTSRAWMTLSMMVLDEGRGDDKRTRRWNSTQVKPDVAVNLRFDDGTELFFVIEPDVSLRRLDPDSWEPDHPLARAVNGLAVGAQFTGPDGRKGVVDQIRHKYVARFHYILEHHEARFPQVTGFRRVAVEPEQLGGIDALIEMLRARHDWIRQEEEQYINGPWPLGYLAHRLGTDAIDVGAGLASNGIQLKVAAGNATEREVADRAVRANGKRGCVLDLLTFWTSWRLCALEAIEATCGLIHVPQSVIDRLRTRREQLDASAADGVSSVAYVDGRIALTETAAEVVASQRDEVDRAIAWIESNAKVVPIIANEDLPPALRKYLQIGRSDVFDSLILAIQTRKLLISDDLPTREIGQTLSGVEGSWLHVVFKVALELENIDMGAYIRWSAGLVDAGQSYLGVSGQVLAHAVRLEESGTERPGPLFRSLSMMIGGQRAEPRSHVDACVTCLSDLWSDQTTKQFRQPVSGYLLSQLVRERTNDYHKLLQAVIARVGSIPELQHYILDWVRGHFLFDRGSQQ